jgi:hypothetical protein
MKKVQKKFKPQNFASMLILNYRLSISESIFFNTFSDNFMKNFPSNCLIKVQTKETLLSTGMVFCYQNCSDLRSSYCEKKLF